MMLSVYKPLSTVAKFVFWFVAVNALIGAISLTLFPTRTETLFFWKIAPPISAALFGALYLGGAATVGYITWRGYWEPARYLVPILVTAGILLTFTTFLHLDKFTPGLKLYYWLAVYMGAPVLAILFYWHYEQGATWEVERPILPATRTVAVITGGLLLFFGAVTLARPDMIVTIWPWDISPLMVRVFGSWFSAFGVGLLWFLREHDWNRLSQIPNLMIAAAGLDLLMVFIHRGDLTGSPLSIGLFCAHLAAFGGIGIFMHWSQRQMA